MEIWTMEEIGTAAAGAILAMFGLIGWARVFKTFSPATSADPKVTLGGWVRFSLWTLLIMIGIAAVAVASDRWSWAAIGVIEVGLVVCLMAIGRLGRTFEATKVDDPVPYGKLALSCVVFLSGLGVMGAASLL